MNVLVTYRDGEKHARAAGTERNVLATDADDKVTRHEQELNRQLQIDIVAAGEGGWRSPWHTGPSDRLPFARQHAYQVWQLARDDWTRTGNPWHLERVLNAVDFDNPPHPSEVRLPPARQPQRKPMSAVTFGQQLLTLGVLYLMAVIMLFAIGLAVT